MRPAQKTSPVKLHRGGGPIPKGSPAVKQRKLSPAALRSKRLKEKESLDKRNNNPLSKAAATPLRERRLRAAALKRKRLKEKKGTPKEPFNPIDKVRGGRPDPLLKEPFNPIDKVPGGRPDPLLRARRRRAAAALKKRRLAAANKANSSAVRNDNKQAASDLAKFNAARKRQAKKATPTARRTAKPVGDRRAPVSRPVPFRGTGKPPTARRTAKPVGDRRVPVSRRIR